MQDRTYWNLGAVTIIGTDTITTQLAFATGEAKELNPFVKEIITSAGFIELAIFKGIALMLIYGMWRLAEWEDNWYNNLLKWGIPRGVCIAGVVITLLNTVQLIVWFLSP